MSDLVSKLLKLAGDNPAGTATKRDPAKWEAAKRKAKAKMGGKHSARAMQLATKYYKEDGGGYKGKEPNASNNKLKKWTKQDWQWSGERDKESSALGILVEKLAGKGVYLPAKSIDALKSTAEGRNKLRAAGRKKTEATNRGEQVARHGLHEGRDRSKLGYTYSDQTSNLVAGGGLAAPESTFQMLTYKIASDSKLEEVKNKLRVAILSGSTGEDARSRALATAYGKYLTEHGAEVDTIDMRDLGDLPDVMTGDTSFIDPYLDRFSNADAFVVSTPIYNWGPSGKVKHFLDLAMDSDSMSYKPYSLLSGAGSSRSALALGGLANQIDMELKGIGIGAGVQAAGHDYNKETGTLTDDIVSRANENAAKLLQVAGALRGKTASFQDPLILGYKTGQKLAYAAFGRKFSTKFG